MATAKKTPAKKTTSTSKKAPAKKAPAKKTVAVKAVTAKKVTTKKPVTKKTAAKKAEKDRSFKLSTNQPAFTSFAITRQTVYWVILVSIIIFFQLWILNLQLEVSELIEMQRMSLEESL